ncbi:MAG: DNA polymerase IV [Burkholderiaceae bacterium]|nr:DNA polymerase IV [Burkholderiaceae bacterium]
MSLQSRRIAHVDMDAFYASVELLRRPELAGRPVAIGGSGNPDSRGVVTTATYPARRYGIRSGMPLRKAAQLCPDCVFLPVDFAAYRDHSRRFKAALAAIEPCIEDRGIDEVYVDLSARAESSEALGRAMKQAIRDATRLTCSVGIAPNKLLAKIASDLDKPDGLAIVTADDIAGRIWPLPAGRINGVGPKASARLARLGIETIGALAGASPGLLQKHFGATYGRWLLQVAHGIDDRPVVTESEPKSRSRETTFERDLHPRRHDDEIRELIHEMSTQVATDLARSGHLARTIGVKIRYDDFSRVTRDLSLARPTGDAGEIERAALVCLRRSALRRPIRLLGVKACNLERSAEAGPLDLAPQLF